MRILSDFKPHLDKRIKTLNTNQSNYFQKMLVQDRMTLCIPTGAGKGYLMITHMMHNIITTKQDIFVTLTHRLTLNAQHLNDIVESFEPLLGNVGFIFIGSSPYNNIYDKYNSTDNIKLTPDEIQSKMSFNRFCHANKINSQDLFTNTLDSNVIKDTINKHRIAGRKTVIICTYHSSGILASAGLEIDVAYCDEAHTMATDLFSDDVNFYNSYAQLTIKQSLFFTATPKDCDDPKISDQSALMNNSHIYGERIGMSFKEAIEDGYVVQPVIHTSYLRDGFVDKEPNMISITKFVIRSFEEHCVWVKKVSSQPDMINGKMLIKCESVKMMWALARSLSEQTNDTIICCGASSAEHDIDNHTIGLCHRVNWDYIKNREEYLLKLQSFTDTDRAIVLHFDTLSEGINISSFTGVMFLSENLPSKPKLLQNTGRTTRMHPEDREKLRQGIIKPNEYGTWVKPHCAIIIPYWSHIGHTVKQTIAETIMSLRDDYGFKSGSDYGLGNHMGIGSNDPPKEYLNITKYYKEGKLDLLQYPIEQYIENLYIEKEKAMESDKLKKMSNEDWFLHNFPL